MTNAPALKQRYMPGTGPLCAVFLPPEPLISRRSRQLPPGEAMDGQAKRYRNCHICQKRWNVSVQSPGPKQYICPHCDRRRARR